MKQRLLMLFVAVAMCVCTAIAQIKVQGTVIEQDTGEPVIGASIMVQGTKKGAVTDINGNFKIEVPNGAKLTFSYVGFQKTTLAAKPKMTVYLKPDNENLNEVIVTGVQAMDKRLFTGAATKIEAEQVKLDGIADVSRALEGRVAGVSVQNISSTFGTAPKIRVRGATSIYGSSTPLWVVDGVILESVVDVSADDLSSGDAETVISNAIAGLNADDIESFQVLKDGSATSIYGARAMAGVIVITTKKGKPGHSTINYTGEFTYRMKPSYREYNICNSQEQMGIYKEMAAKGWLEFSALANGSTSGLYGSMYHAMARYDETSGQFGLPHTTAAMNSYLQQAEFRNTDWFDLLFNNNIMHNHSVSIATGSDKANLYASLSAMQDPGWYKDSKVARYTANVNASFNLSRILTVTLRSNASYIDQTLPGTMNQDLDVVSGRVSRNFDINPFSYAMNTSRTLDPNGIYKRNYADFNIFDELESNYIERKSTDFKLQGEVKIQPIKGLNINLIGSYRVNNSTREHIILNNSNQANAYRAGVNNPNVMYNNKFLYQNPDKPNSLPVSVMPEGGINILNKNSVSQLDFRGTVSYDHYWRQGNDDEAHIFNALLGMEANRADYDSFEDNVFGVDYNNARIVTITPDLYKQAKEEGTQLQKFGKSWNRRMAYFINMNYSYKGIYSLNLTGRYDGSNQLGRATKSRWLPTGNVSVAWNAHEESFFKRFREKNKDVWSHATIRMGYSLVGEQTNASNALPIYRASELWRPQGDQQETIIYLSTLGNSSLTYEKKVEFNLGIDLGFFNNRLNLVADIYWRNNKDLIGYVNTQGAGGEIRKFANVASMKGNGAELTISSKNIVTKNWLWTTDFTFSYANTEITDVLAQSRVIDLCQQSGYIRKGYPHRSLFSIPFVGLNDEGIPTFINEKGEVTTSDINFQEYEKLDNLKYEGSIDPTITGGLNNMIKWKNWRLNIFITYSAGNKIRLDPVFSASYSDMAAMPKEFKNRWVIPGDENKTTIPTIASVRQNYNDNYLGTAYNAYNYSSARVADGGFIRLKDISLTYEFPSKWINKIGLSTASLKFDATNVCLIYADKKLNGQDPEYVSVGGVSSPLSKQFTFTLRLGI